MKESIYERNARIGADVKRAQFEAKMMLSFWYQNANDGKNWSRNRSRTFPGIAKALAEQWG